MATIIDPRMQIEGNLFAEIGPGGSLIFSSGFIGGVGDDEELHIELIVSPEGIERIIDLLCRRRLTKRAADGLCPNCGRDYFENETIIDGELRCSCARR